MYTLVLLRHGESQWNKENRFTGWADVDLSKKGIQEAQSGGKALKDNGYTFDIAYVSLLKRAIKTLWLTLEEMDYVDSVERSGIERTAPRRFTRIEQSRNSCST